MIELVKVNNVYNTVVNFYEADTDTDKASIDTSVIGIGSTVHVIETDTTYMLNGSKQWVEVSKGGGSGGGSALPAISTADYGKFLGVNSSGEWDPSFSCEIVHFTEDESGWQADKTFAEITEALSATKLVIGMNPYGNYLFPTFIDQYGMTFVSCNYSDNEINSQNFYINYDNSVEVNNYSVYGDNGTYSIYFSDDIMAAFTSAATVAITDAITNNTNGYGWADGYSQQDSEMVSNTIDASLDMDINFIMYTSETTTVNVTDYGISNDSYYFHFIIPAYEFNDTTFRLTVSVNNSTDGYYHIQFIVIAEQLYVDNSSVG